MNKFLILVLCLTVLIVLCESIHLGGHKLALLGGGLKAKGLAVKGAALKKKKVLALKKAAALKKAKKLAKIKKLKKLAKIKKLKALKLKG